MNPLYVECMSIDGTWSRTTQTCFKIQFLSSPRNKLRLWETCLNSAPQGARGRLAHVKSPQVYDEIKYVCPGGGTECSFAAYAPLQPGTDISYTSPAFIFHLKNNFKKSPLLNLLCFKSKS